MPVSYNLLWPLVVFEFICRLVSCQRFFFCLRFETSQLRCQQQQPKLASSVPHGWRLLAENQHEQTCQRYKLQRTKKQSAPVCCLHSPMWLLSSHALYKHKGKLICAAFKENLSLEVNNSCVVSFKREIMLYDVLLEA